MGEPIRHRSQGARPVSTEPAVEATSFVIAALAVTPTPWDKEGNFEKLELFATRAADQGAALVVTPEGFLEGYLWNDHLPRGFSPQEYLAVGETVDGPLLTRVRDLARRLRVHLLVGFAERQGDRMFNSAVIVSPTGGLILRYAKTHTAGDDEPYNTKGTDFPVVDTPFGRWGTLICMDRQFPEAFRILALRGAQLVVVPAWGGYGEMNDVMMRTRAYENGVHVAFVHPRRCLLIGPDGDLIAQQDCTGDEIVAARIDLSPPAAHGPIRRRRPELYGDLVAGQ